jgi:hypothetical protein
MVTERLWARFAMPADENGYLQKFIGDNAVCTGTLVTISQRFTDPGRPTSFTPRGAKPPTGCWP